MNFDCFGLQNLNGKYSCKALKKLDCDDCNFFKTTKQAKKDRKLAMERLKSLDMTSRVGISDKYKIEII